jgi:hypothetical protein
MPLRVKLPGEVLDFSFDWTDSYLQSGETIDTSAVAVEPTGELTIDSDSEASGIATVWLSAGTRGNRYLVKNTIATNQGRTDVQELEIMVI